MDLVAIGASAPTSPLRRSPPPARRPRARARSATVTPADRAEFTVVADGYPHVRAVCARCGALRGFACTGDFRVNASGKVIDIWLLYRCTCCASTYQLAVIERTAVTRIDRRLLTGAMANDRALAGRFARDQGLMRRNKVQLARGDAWELIPLPAHRGGLRAPVRIGCTLSPPLIVRADHLVAAALGRSRAAAAAAFRNGELALPPRRWAASIGQLPPRVW